VKPETSLTTSIRNSKSSAELLDKIGETAIDSLLDNGVLKDIPIIGTAISLYRAGNEISAHIFAKKIATFLSEVEKLSIEERERFFNSQPSAKDEESLGETLLLILDKIDSFNLARMLGKAFRLLVSGVISKGEYDIYIQIIKQLNPYLITQIKNFYENESFCRIDSPAAVTLSNHGITKIAILGTLNEATKEINTSPKRTSFGEKFYKSIVQ
jgi:protein involved in sex pheromone biosynthesis